MANEADREAEVRAAYEWHRSHFIHTTYWRQVVGTRESPIPGSELTPYLEAAYQEIRTQLKSRWDNEKDHRPIKVILFDTAVDYPMKRNTQRRWS